MRRTGSVGVSHAKVGCPGAMVVVSMLELSMGHLQKRTPFSESFDARLACSALKMTSNIATLADSFAELSPLPTCDMCERHLRLFHHLLRGTASFKGIASGRFAITSLCTELIINLEREVSSPSAHAVISELFPSFPG